MLKREILAFRKDIQPNTTEVLSERIKANGVVEEIRIRFYPGVERALHVRPFVQHHAETMEDVYTYPEGTEYFISGDDDYLMFPVSVPVMYDDFMKVWVNNVDTNYSYTLSVDVVISYLTDEVSV